ncbi:MAG: hypothetical protein LBU80_08000 [Rikenellaceae bacterium]|nr:hypothetical protein [Rikenellaceae bacterium]
MEHRVRREHRADTVAATGTTHETGAAHLTRCAAPYTIELQTNDRAILDDCQIG